VALSAGLAAFLLPLVVAATPFGPPRDQVLFGRIASLRPAAGHVYVMRFDPGLWLSGRTATDYARERYGSPDVPNDHLVYDPDHRLFTYVVPADARATVVTNNGSGITSTRVTVAQLARIVAGKHVVGVKPFEAKNPFWITVEVDRAVALDQQYTP